MRRTILLLATMTLALIVAGGMALAATISCPSGGGNCYGTDSDDRINGTNNDEHIFGYGGNDTLDGNGGFDHVLGDGQLDTATTPDGNDKVNGGADADRIYGFGGSDTLIGGSGDDYIDAETGESETPQAHNIIKAGKGIDEVSATNGVQDTIDCGTGSDHVFVDPGGLDKVDMNCEEAEVPIRF